ncbi:hypothetical protein [Pseudosulfitobacter sp. DSM 107133]|jgi:hypothetical protein|uniref:hypothetical protein n=1 Tax=Pseudosulfitobacter sp. DSM 107133 TaxID=2883100 RepID=UPI000DF363A8|nr:hypothetical protein [Pseudosulfitobacter sp. DSM 107133]UOA26086.1 hypothetical protein DSM107133_00777 [Pseudosulfitobacter sp. DSM 107133]
MKSEWILDVLTDLRAFAYENGLPLLAEQLDDTAIVAMAEISSRADPKTGGAYDAECADGNKFGEAGAV